MNINDVITMREIGGPFAGALFLTTWFIIKTWMFWMGFFTAAIINKYSKPKSKTEKA